MNFRLSILCILGLFFSFHCYGQKNNLEGQILDVTDGSPMIGVGVLISKEGDSTQTMGTATDVEGKFSIGLEPGKYRLKITYIGYRNYLLSVSLTTENKDIGIVRLEQEAIALKDVVVEGRQIRSVQKGDTTEYNANAFKTNPDATVQDLIAKMPGISVENGTVKAQGETVQKVTVDGKDFFGDDASVALKNLPAEVVDKIQVYNRLSDQSQFTGVDDGNSIKSINIVTKNGMNNGQFGKVFAGYGSNERYQLGGNLNVFNGTQRISILGLANNVNQQNFSSQDLLGVSGSGGGRGGNTGGRSGAGGGSSGAGNTSSNFLTGQQSGINFTQSAGLNYSDSWGKKLTLTGSYFFNRTENKTNSSINREYFLSEQGNQLYDQLSSGGSTNTNHRLNFRIEYKIDSSNSLLITPKISFQNNLSDNGQEGQTRLKEGALLNQTFNNNNAANNGYTFGNNILFRHKFAKPRRTVSVNFGTGINNQSGTNSLFAQNNYYSLTASDSSTILDQRTTSAGTGFSVSTSLMYSEPIGAKGNMQLSYSPSYSKSTSERLTEKKDVGNTYSILDSILSSRYDNTVVTQKIGTRYVYNSTKFDFNMGIEGQRVSLDGQQEFPRSFGTDKSFNNLLPNAMFYYKVTKTSNLRLQYRSQTDVPSISQLQNVVNNTNPLQLSTGNPNLKQEYSHLLQTRIRLTDTEKARALYVFLSGTYTRDYIGSATAVASGNTEIENGIILKEGSQLTRPANLQGYWNANTLGTYSLPIDFFKSNLNVNAGFSYTRTPSRINEAMNFANTLTENIGFALGSNVSEKIDFTVSSTGFYNIVKNSIRPQLNNNYYNQISVTKCNLMPWKGWVVSSEWNHTFYIGLGAGYDINFVLWNAGLGYKFLKNNSGELKLTVFDLLNQNKSIGRNVTGNYVENTRTQVLTRYFMLTFTYNIRNFNGKGDISGARPENQDNRVLPAGRFSPHGN